MLERTVHDLGFGQRVRRHFGSGYFSALHRCIAEMVSHYHHKDSSPQETTQRLRTILSGVGLNLREKNWNSVHEIRHSPPIRKACS